MKSLLAFAASLALGAAALIPLAAQAHDNSTMRVQYRYDSGPRYAVPVERYDYAPARRHGYKWIPSHWKRDGHRVYWVNGYWMPVQRDYGVMYERDGDRDGIPDRYDHDRDGDGVPNRFDRRPDNPYR